MKSPQPLIDSRKREILELGEAVADTYCPSVTVKPETILVAKGITFNYGQYGEHFDGMLECKAGRFHVFCNLDRVGSRHSPRARFTLAHELGHYFLDEHRNALLSGRVPAHPSRCEFESTNQAEREADLFASGLLLPQRRFLDAARAAPHGLPGILTLAKQFVTSVTSTAIRYADCDLFPCAVVKWTTDGAVAWKWLSTEMFRARYRRVRVEGREQLPFDSATAEAFGSNERITLPFERGSTAAAWFAHVPTGSARNLILIEQALPLGRYGVLTFLYAQE